MKSEKKKTIVTNIIVEKSLKKNSLKLETKENLNINVSKYQAKYKSDYTFHRPVSKM